jgi:hypothetical protein
MKRIIFLLTILSGLVFAQASYAYATDWGIALENNSTYVNLQANDSVLNSKLSGTSNFTNHTAAGFVRAWISWDALASYNGSSCVALAPGNIGNGPTGFWQLEAAIRAAQSHNLRTIITVTVDAGYTWNNWAGPPVFSGGVSPTPTDTPNYGSAAQQYDCGIRQIRIALQNDGLWAWNGPQELEPWNEPDINDTTPGAHTTYVPPITAANFYTWANIETNTSNANVIAGVFGHPGDAAYQSSYFSYLYSDLGRWPTSWSVHDYYDINSSVDTGVATQNYAWQFQRDLQNQGIPSSDIWITEAAYNAGLSSNSVTAAQQETAAGKAWSALYNYGPEQHLLWEDVWYSGPKYPGFESSQNSPNATYANM